MKKSVGGGDGTLGGGAVDVRRAARGVPGRPDPRVAGPPPRVGDDLAAAAGPPVTALKAAFGATLGADRRQRAAQRQQRADLFRARRKSGDNSAGRFLCGDPRRLTDLDEAAVWVAHVTAELMTPVCRRCQELGPAIATLLVGGVDVGDADVEEAADVVGVARRLKRHGRLVIGGWAAELMMIQPARRRRSAATGRRQRSR
jgi:hypothetical protein